MAEIIPAFTDFTWSEMDSKQPNLYLDTSFLSLNYYERSEGKVQDAMTSFNKHLGSLGENCGIE
jgi:hypothetical protein